MRPLIALSGRKFSGKSTLAKEIAAAYDIPIVNFAGPLKAGCLALGVEIDGPNKDVTTLQDIGLYFRQNKGYDWWIRVLDRNTADRIDTGLVIDDLRYKNEYKWCQREGMLLVRCDVSRETQLRRAAMMGMTPNQLAAIDFTHSSETDLDDVDHWHIRFDEGSTVDERLKVIGMDLAGVLAI